MNTQPRMILAGGSGFLGEILADYFTARRWEVVILTRNNGHMPLPRADKRYVHWDGRTIGPWAAELEGAQALINLSGQTVNCRYTKKNKQRLIESRLAPTQVLSEALTQCKTPPLVWMNASTATLYKHTYDEAWDENGEIGPHPAAKDAFSIELAKAWEATFEKAHTPGTRKIALRTAMVFGQSQNPNNVFTTLRRLVKFGLGGKMGDGRQYVSWIHAEDFCRAIEWLIEKPEIDGVVNICAPEPIPNREMMRLFRTEFNMPIGLPAPRAILEIGAFLIRTETELIIKSRRVIPGRLLAEGFTFHYPTIAGAIKHLTNPQ